MIRKLSAEDIANLKRIDHDSFTKKLNHKIYRKILRESKGFAFWEKDQLVGYLIYQIKNDDILLRRMAVAPKFRRKNIASKLLQKILSEIRTAKFYLHIREKNLAAQKFFLKHGFEKKKRIKNFYKNGDAAIVFEKIIV